MNMHFSSNFHKVIKENVIGVYIEILKNKIIFFKKKCLEYLVIHQKNDMKYKYEKKKSVNSSSSFGAV